jgi:hypothetical protein
LNREQSLALFATGRDAWNAWAEKMSGERAALEAEGTWVDDPFESEWNEPTRAWHAAAAADFSAYTFQEPAEFSGFVFPGDARFGEASFSGDADFYSATFSGHAEFGKATFTGKAWFDGTTFTGDALFDRTTFTGEARFDKVTFTGAARFKGATFMGDAAFGEATFKGGAGFDGATFMGDAGLEAATFAGDAGFGRANFADSAWFGAATFVGDAEFVGVTFAGDAGFDAATFAGRAWFSGAIFREGAGFGGATFTGDAWFGGATFAGRAGFLQAVFEGIADFDHAKFEGSANFRAIEAKSAFSLASANFLVVPDFIQAHFAEAPRLDDCRIAPPRVWPTTPARVKDSFTGDPGLAARWRALKRLAIQGHDHAREQAFFKGELKARRWGEDRPWHAVFWFGVFYQVLSDFGRSPWRPLLWWGASVLGFAGLYLGRHPVLAEESASGFAWALGRWTGAGGEAPPLACVAGPGEPWVAAMNLSLHKGLLFFGLVPLDKLNRIHACLYGVHPANAAQPSRLPDTFSPVIPDGVTALGFIQHPLSAVLIFLILLAIRNHFRIK